MQKKENVMCQEKIAINSIDDLYRIEKEKREYFNIGNSDPFKNNLILFCNCSEPPLNSVAFICTK